MTDELDNLKRKSKHDVPTGDARMAKVPKVSTSPEDSPCATDI